MKYAVVLFACTVALSACNKGPEVDVKNASVGEVAEKVRDAAGSGTLIDAGRWETKVSVLDVDMPGMPPQMAQQVKATMARVQDRGYTSCLTEADVRKPKEDFFAGRAKNCRYDHFTMSGGKIDAAMSCTSEQGQTVSMTMNGSYASDHYEADMAMDMTGPGAKGMKIKSHTESNRVGECKGDEMNLSSKAIGK